MHCKECYSGNPRITPLLGAQACLESHKQYICSTCGRVVCIDMNGERRARCFMPFKSAEIALLYLKCAEILTGKPCGIYELVYKRGDLRYRIFESGEALQTFLKKHPDVKHDRDEPIYRSKKHVPVQENQVHYLSKKEINTYLQERKALGFRDT